MMTIQMHASKNVRAANLRRVGLGLLTLVTACAGASAANRKAAGVMLNGTFTPALAAAEAYTRASADTCPPTDVVGAVLDSRPRAQLDGALCAIAMTLIGWDASVGAPPEAVRAFLSRYFGVPESDVRVLATPMDIEDPRQIGRRVTDSINHFSEDMTAAHFGVATISIKKGQTAVVLVVLDRHVALDPVPRRLHAGTKAVLSGRLVGGGYENAIVLVADVAGALTTTRVPASEPFRVEIACGDKPGFIAVQIRGEQAGAATTLATFPLACSVPLPTSVALAVVPPAPLDAQAAVAELAALLNQQRAAVGLPALDSDDALTQLARQLASEARNQSQSANRSSTDIMAWLRQAGIVSGVVLQNSVLAGSVGQANEMLLASPTHRSNSLNREATHVGIGVSVVPATATEPTSLWVTEIFIKQKPVIDLGPLRESLRAAIAQKRFDAHMNALATDAVLDEVAQKYAQALASNKGEVPKAQLDVIVAPLSKGLRDVMLLLGARAEPLAFAEEPEIIADSKVIGIGMAQGVHPKLGRNAVFVVVVVGTRTR